MRRALLSFAIFWLVLPPGNGAPGMPGKKGKIHGESYANLRSGPDLGHPVEAVLRQGEEIAVEGQDGSWYLVSSADGKRGYVHKTLVHFLPTEQIVEATVAQGVAKPEEEKKDLPIPPAEEGAEPAPDRKRPPVVRALEGRGWEVLGWLVIGLCIFFVGWICGGNYYLSRDRAKRSKLRF